MSVKNLNMSGEVTGLGRTLRLWQKYATERERQRKRRKRKKKKKEDEKERRKKKGREEEGRRP
jgi:hypothetical protein